MPCCYQGTPEALLDSCAQFRAFHEISTDTTSGVDGESGIAGSVNKRVAVEGGAENNKELHGGASSSKDDTADDYEERREEGTIEGRVRNFNISSTRQISSSP